MPLLDLADIVAGQWGLVTTAQARAVGLTPQAVARLAERGILERLTHGVYRLTGTPADVHDALRAAWLALDPGRTASERLREDPGAVVVSHRSAAALHGLGDLDADVHEFTIPVRRQTRRTDVRFHRGSVPPDDQTIVTGLPVTTVVRTIGDLAAAQLDGGHLAGVVRDALTIQHVDLDAVTEALRPFAHRYGAPLGDGEALTRRLLDEAGLPETTRRTAELAAGHPISEAELLYSSASAQVIADIARSREVIELALRAGGVVEQLTRNSRIIEQALRAGRVLESIDRLPRSGEDIKRAGQASIGLTEVMRELEREPVSENKGEKPQQDGGPEARRPEDV